ncbi:MAG: RNA polymerase sigma factor RpoD/SigA [Bacilli bacterium]|nr:RNA polymerase sigma factor RpoD/SigA [Bacilli bacterium]
MKTKSEYLKNGNSFYDDGTRAYLASIADHPILTKEEEVEISNAIKAGDENAKRRLICCNLRLVVDVAQNYACNGLDFLDLIQEGNMGLMKAAGRFDADKGRFSTYANNWIRGSIMRAIRSKSNIIRKPAYMLSLITKMRKVEASLYSKWGRKPTSIELADVLGITIEQLYNIKNRCCEVVSLNEPLDFNGEQGELIDIVEDCNSLNPETVVVEGITTDDINDILKSRLSERELYIMNMRSEANDYGVMPYREIGDELGLSHKRVCQIQHKSRSKLMGDPRIQGYYR